MRHRSLVQDDDDRGFYEVRIALNGDPVYARMWNSHEAVRSDADAELHRLLNVGCVRLSDILKVVEAVHQLRRN